MDVNAVIFEETVHFCLACEGCPCFTLRKRLDGHAWTVSPFLLSNIFALQRLGGEIHAAKIPLVRDLPLVNIAGGKGGEPIIQAMNAEMVVAWRAFVDSAAWGSYDHSKFRRRLATAGWPAGLRVYNTKHAVGFALAEGGADHEDIKDWMKQAFFTQLATPALSPEGIAAVRQRFESVRTQHYPFDFGPTDHHVENRDLLAAPKYHVLFNLWKKEGDAALTGLASSAIQDAVQAGAGQIETLQLGHRYGHLSPLVNVS